MTAMQYSFDLLFNGEAESVRIYWDYFSDRLVPFIEYVKDSVETTVYIFNENVHFENQRFLD